MSNIELNATNIKKFSKRLHKHATEKGLNISLSESQELFAKSLGHNNYHNLCNNIVEKEKASPQIKEKNTEENISESYNYTELYGKFDAINQEIVKKLIKEDREITIEEEVETFYKKLILVLNVKESGIVNCYLEKGGIEKHEYKIVFTTIYNDISTLDLSSFINEKYLDLHSFVTEKYESLVKGGMKEKDAKFIMSCFNVSGYDLVSGKEIYCSVKLNQRFYMIEFNENLFKFLNNKRKINRKYVFKCIEHENVDNLICLNGKYYRTIVTRVDPNKSHYFKNFKSLQVEGIYKDKECYKLANLYFNNNVEEKEQEPIDLDFDTIIILWEFDILQNEENEKLFFIKK